MLTNNVYIKTFLVVRSALFANISYLQALIFIVNVCGMVIQLKENQNIYLWLSV